MVDNKGKSSGDPITRWLVIGMVALVVVVGAGISIFNNTSKKTAVLPTAASVKDGYGIVFNGDLKPVIDIWEDFQCPSCKAFEGTNGDALRALVVEKKAKIVFHPLSFLGPESVYAANGAACAADQGKFLEYHALMYKNQPAENSGAWSNEGVIATAAAAGVTGPEFEACVNKGKYAGWVGNVGSEGSKQNINSTPTVFINGKEVDRASGAYYSAPEFMKLLVAAGIK
ncbi:MAG: thioredoxin domain-containing protein [Actinomycetes bacterium]|nr:protein-disulfide isomerase [Actinomycetota bacterium]